MEKLSHTRGDWGDITNKCSVAGWIEFNFGTERGH